jgi:hypothetical protein
VEHDPHVSTPPFKTPHKVKMAITPCPKDEVTDILNYGDSTHFVSAVFHKNHFVVLYYNIVIHSVTVFDGLDMSISNWQNHILHTIRIFPLGSTWLYNFKNDVNTKGRRDMLIEIDFDKSCRYR